MASSLTSIVAAKKLASIKKNYKLTVEDDAQDSPENQLKLQEKVEKDQRKREKEKVKREEKHSERDRQREKLRSRIKEKYSIEDTSIKEKEKKKPLKGGELREKDFYKYNKAMPEERGKKLESKNDANAGSFAESAAQLSGGTGKVKKKDKKDECLIS